MHSIALFGGSFDPIHNGHMQTSLAIQKDFHFDSFLFVPCKVPVLKTATLASPEQRVAMLELAIQAQQTFNIDLREINRDSPSYMVETLQSFRADYPQASISLIIGYDALLSLPQWFHWQKIIELANILVLRRTEFVEKKIPVEIQQLIEKHGAQTKSQLLTHKAGYLLQYDAGDFIVSSTMIRECIKHKQDISQYVPQAVKEYISKLAIYSA